MEVEWQQTYETLKQKYDEAIKAFELGKNDELQKNRDIALINYRLAISLVDEALATPVALPENMEEVDDTWRMGLQIVQNLKRMRAEILRHISILAPSSSAEEGAKCLPPLTQTSKSLNRPRTFSELAQALQNLEYHAIDEGNLPNVLELLFSCDGIKLYYIASTGEVTTTDESSTLRIIRLDQDVTQNLDATFFMQIIRSSAAETIQSDSEDNDEETENVIDLKNDISTQSLKKLRANIPPKSCDTSLMYPLVPGVSPCFSTQFGAFIFPDLQSETKGAAFGLVVPKPADEIVLEILEAILHGVVRQESEEFVEVLEEGEEAEKPLSERMRSQHHASERISNNIIQGACMISNGLVKGTEQVGKFVSYTTPFVISKLSKAPADRPIPPKVTGGIELAKTATSTAIGITGFIANKVGTATMALGKFLAPHVHAQGSKVLSKTMGYSNEEAEDKVSVFANSLILNMHRIFFKKYNIFIIFRWSMY